MAPLLEIDADANAVLAVFERFPDALQRHVKAAAKVTADRIVAEADRRIARAAAGPTRSRHTAEGLKAVETDNGEGYLVVNDSPEMPGLPGWLEHGTKFMEARPYFFVSADLEAAAHHRRIAEATQQAIDETGLGE